MNLRSPARTQPPSAEEEGDEHECDGDPGENGIVRGDADDEEGHSQNEQISRHLFLVEFHLS